MRGSEGKERERTWSAIRRQEELGMRAGTAEETHERRVLARSCRPREGRREGSEKVERSLPVEYVAWLQVTSNQPAFLSEAG